MIKVKTSVILVNYNSLNDTIECIDSLRIAMPEAFIVVVENGSGDKDSIVKSLANAANLKIIVSDINLGFGRANNLAITWINDNLDPDYILLLNNDTVVERSSLDILQSCLDNEDNTVVMAAPKIFVYSEPDELWYGGGSFDFVKMTPKLNPDPTSGGGLTSFASGCSMFFRARYLFSIGGFDPFFFMYDEDVDLCLRIKMENRSILYIPEAVIYHKCQGSQTKFADVPFNQLHPDHPSLHFYLQNTIHNRRYIISKYFSGSRKLGVQIKHSIYWGLKGLQFLVHGNFRAATSVIRNLLLSPIPKSMK